MGATAGAVVAAVNDPNETFDERVERFRRDLKKMVSTLNEEYANTPMGGDTKARLANRATYLFREMGYEFDFVVIDRGDSPAHLVVDMVPRSFEASVLYDAVAPVDEAKRRGE